MAPLVKRKSLLVPALVFLDMSMVFESRLGDAHWLALLSRINGALREPVEARRSSGSVAAVVFNCLRWGCCCAIFICDDDA